MVTSSHVSQPSSMYVPRSTLELHFDFVVAEKSIYIPGSGPEVPNPTPMAEHDRDGYIISELRIDRGDFTYIVTWKDKPHLLVSVRPQKIRDYVSARSYEEWNTKKSKEELKGLQSGNVETDVETHQKPKDLPETKRKGKRNKKTVEEAGLNPDIQLPIKSSLSQNNISQLTSLSPHPASIISPSSYDLDPCDEFSSEVRTGSISKKRSNGDCETDGQLSSVDLNIYNADEVIASEHQRSHFDSQIKKNSVRAPRLMAENNHPLLAPLSNTSNLRESTLAKLRPTRSTSNSVTPNPNKNMNYVENGESQLQKLSEMPSDGPTALASQNVVKKNLAKRSQNKRSRQSFESYVKIKSSPPRSRRKTIMSVAQLQNESDSDVDREVEDIKDEKWEQDRKGNGVLFYLVKWKGIPSYTWEPEENIGSDVLTKYTALTLSRSKDRYRRSSDRSLLCLNTEDKREKVKQNHDDDLSRDGKETDTTKTTRKAKQRAMAINMFEPEIPKRKGGGIPGDLGDEDELFQVTSGRRRK